MGGRQTKRLGLRLVEIYPAYYQLETTPNKLDAPSIGGIEGKNQEIAEKRQTRVQTMRKLEIVGGHVKAQTNGRHRKESKEAKKRG